MDYLTSIHVDPRTGNFILGRDEVPIPDYATFTGLKLYTAATDPILTECTASFTNERLLITRKLSPSSGNVVVGWGLKRKYIRLCQDCSSSSFLKFKISRRIRLVLEDPDNNKILPSHLELKFSENDFIELKPTFLQIEKILRLCVALEENQLESFQNILERNPELVNMPIGSRRNTLLIMACARNKMDFTRYLLRFRDIDINKTSTVRSIKDGKLHEDVFGPLYYACLHNMEEAVDIMVSTKGVDLNIRYVSGLTALHVALQKDIEVQRSSDITKKNYHKIISLIMSHRNSIWKISDGWLPLSWLLDATYETQKAILKCGRAKELSSDVKEKLTRSIEVGRASIEEKRNARVCTNSINQGISRSDSFSTVSSIMTGQESSKIIKSGSFESISSRNARSTSSTVNHHHQEEVNKFKIMSEDLVFSPIIQISYTCLQLLIIDNSISLAKQQEKYEMIAYLAQKRKVWYFYKFELLQLIDQTIQKLPELLYNDNIQNNYDEIILIFNNIKLFLLNSINEYFNECLWHATVNGNIFEGIEKFKNQVNDLKITSELTIVLPQDNSAKSAGPTASAGGGNQPLPLPPGKKSHLFLSHAWGLDEEDRDNHQRTSKLNEMLKELGIITWFDSDRIHQDTGLLRTKLADAIYSTCCVLIIITKEYEKKVNSGQSSENCLFEFDLASTTSDLVRITTVMENSMLDPKSWQKGRFKAEVSSILHTNLSTDDKFEENCQQIVKRIVQVLHSPPYNLEF